LDARSASEELRVLRLPHRRFGGYSREAVDETIGKAARAIDRLTSELKAGQEELVRTQVARAELESELQVARLRSPAEIVGDVLVTAHRAAQSVIEDAHRISVREQQAARQESNQVLERARQVLHEAAAAQRQAEGAVAAADSEAQALIEAAEVKARELVAGATETAVRRQSQLQTECARLETAIKSLRSEWVGRAAEALARLEGLDSELPAAAILAEEDETEMPDDLQGRLVAQQEDAVSRPPGPPD
jgi:hypothetical protein